MDAHGQHCPFLNRSEPRCSENLSLEDLRHAFSHCFGEYQECPAYAVLLDERETRRYASVRRGGDLVHAPRLIQVSVARRLKKPIARFAAVSALSGV